MLKEVVCPDCKINVLKVYNGRHVKKCLRCRNEHIKLYNQKYQEKLKNPKIKSQITCKRCNINFTPLSNNHKYCGAFCRSNIVSQAEKWLNKNPGKRNSRNKAFDSFKIKFSCGFVNDNF